MRVGFALGAFIINGCVQLRRNRKSSSSHDGAEKNSAFQNFRKKIFAICRKCGLMTSGVENDTTRILYVLYSNFFTCRAGCAIILVHVSLLLLPCFQNLWPPLTPSTVLVNNKQQQTDTTVRRIVYLGKTVV